MLLAPMIGADTMMNNEDDTYFSDSLVASSSVVVVDGGGDTEDDGNHSSSDDDDDDASHSVTSDDSDEEDKEDDDNDDKNEGIHEILHIFDAVFHGFSDDQITAMLDDDDRKDWEDLNELRLVLNHRKQLRKKKWRHIRKDLGYLHRMMLHTDQFSKTYRMEKDHFDYLLGHLADAFGIDELQSIRSTSGNEFISPERILASGLEHFGEGSSIRSMAHSYGVSESSMKRMVDVFVDAIIMNTSCEELRIQLPDPSCPKQLRDLSQRWSEVSTAYTLFDGYLGSLDGLLQRTEMPFDVTNQVDYFSGHYQCYGLNMQAMCDPDLIFMYAACAAPGKVNDNRAFQRCEGLVSWIDALPDRYFVGADNAYPLSRKLLIPFSGAESSIEHHRTYNFYLSQLRIRIEMAFGLLTTKWRILRTTLRCSSANNARTVRVCMMLHNFCIRMIQRDEGWKLGTLSQCRSSLIRLGGINREGCGRGRGCNRFGYMPTVNEGEESDDDHMDAGDDGNDIDSNDCDSIIQSNNSHRCEIVKEIYIHEIQRPIHNKRRNALSQNEATGDESDDEEYEAEEDENGVAMEWTNDYDEY